MSSTDPKQINPDTGLDEGYKVSNPNLKSAPDSDPDFVHDSPFLQRSSRASQGTPLFGTYVDDSNYNQNLSKTSVDEGRLERVRAANQGMLSEASNFLVRAALGEVVLGTLEGVGYIGSALTNIGKSPVQTLADAEKSTFGALAEWAAQNKEALGENYKIYQDAPGTFNPGDSGWWFDNGVSVASSLSMLIPSRGFVGLIGKIGRATRLTNAMRLGGNASWLLKGIGGAVTSRHIENMMEARGTFQEQYDKYSSLRNEDGSLKYNDEQARKMAADAASFNYNAGWAMLAQDVAEHLFLFKTRNPFTGVGTNPLKKSLTSSLSEIAPVKKLVGNKTFGKVAGTFGTALSEGAEEAYQFIIAEEAKYRADLSAGLIQESEFNERFSDYLEDDELWNSAFFGALGGGLFQALGDKVTDAAQKIIDPSGFQQRKEWQTRQATWMNQRNAEFASLNEKMKLAQEKGDEAAMNAIRAQLNVNIPLDAIEMGQLDSYKDFLNSMKEYANSSEQAEGQDGLDKEFIRENIDDMIKASDEIEKLFNSYKRNNNPNVLKALVYNDYFRGKTLDSLQSDQATRAKMLSDYPGAENLSPEDSHMLDLNLQLNAEQVKSKLFESLGKNNNDDMLLKKAEDAKVKIEKIKNDIKEAKEVNKDNEKDPTSEDIYNIMLNNSDLLRLSNSISQKKDLLNIYSKRIELLKDKKYQESSILDQLKMRISNMNTTEEIDAEIDNINNNENLTPEQKEMFLKTLKDQRNKVVSSVTNDEVKQKQSKVAKEKVKPEKKVIIDDENLDKQMDTAPDSTDSFRKRLEEIKKKKKVELEQDEKSNIKEKENDDILENPEVSKAIEEAEENISPEEDYATEQPEEDPLTDEMNDDIPDNTQQEIDNITVDLTEPRTNVDVSDDALIEDTSPIAKSSELNYVHADVNTEYEEGQEGIDLIMGISRSAAIGLRQLPFYEFSRLPIDKRGLDIKFSTPHLTSSYNEYTKNIINKLSSTIDKLVADRNKGLGLQELSEKYKKTLDIYPIVGTIYNKNNEIYRINDRPVEAFIPSNHKSTYKHIAEARRDIALNSILNQFNDENIETKSYIEGQFPLKIKQKVGLENNILTIFKNTPFKIRYIDRLGSFRTPGTKFIDNDLNHIALDAATQAGKFYAVVDGVRGRPVVIKLNNKLHDKETATYIADLYGYLLKNRVKLNDPIQDKDLLDRLYNLFPDIKNLMGKEITYINVSNFLVHSVKEVNQGTIKQFYLESGKLFFDIEKPFITAKNFDVLYNDLVEYLQKKNWPIDQNNLANNENYRNFVYENKLLNTDVSPNGDGEIFVPAKREKGADYTGRIFFRSSINIEITDNNVTPEQASKLPNKPKKQTKTDKEVAKMAKENGDIKKTNSALDRASALLEESGDVKDVLPSDVSTKAKDILKNLQKKKC